MSNNDGSFNTNNNSISEQKPIYAYCDVCKKETKQCQYRYHGQYGNSKPETRCMECNGGEGNYPHECYECWWWENDNDDD
jgi:hypothetical protein